LIAQLTDNFLFHPSVELDPTEVVQVNADEQHSTTPNTEKAYKDLVPPSLLSIQLNATSLLLHFLTLVVLIITAMLSQREQLKSRIPTNPSQQLQVILPQSPWLLLKRYFFLSSVVLGTFQSLLLMSLMIPRKRSHMI
jgi:hypothetical protein